MFKSRDGWEIYSEPWSIRTIYSKFSNDKLVLNWSKNRGFVWKRSKSSLFIHSILWGIINNTETFRYSKHGNKYYCSDGRQRSTTILKFINNEFSILGTSKKFPIYVNGELYNINGKYFRQLPEDLQNQIWDFQINAAILDNAPSDVEAEVFRRCNNGEKVSKADIAVSQNESSEIIDEISKHPIFNKIVGKNSAERKTARAEVAKTWIALNEEIPTFGSHVNKVLAENIFTNDDKELFFEVYDFVFNAYKIVDIQNKDLAKIMMNKVHFYAYIPYWEAFDTPKEFATWIEKFFDNMPQEYIDVNQENTMQASNVSIRNRIVRDSILDFVQK